MDELQAGKSIKAEGFTLVPIERCFFQSTIGDMGCCLYGRKEPYAIIVADAAGIRAFNAQAIPMPVDTLAERIPGLSELLAPLTP